MRIAFLGSRGIPARYSGFETFYEQLGTRLAQRGHEVTVYNRSHFIRDVRREYAGVRIVSLPSIRTKHLDTISHTFLSTCHALARRYQIVYYCIVGNSPLAWLPRLRGARTFLNVDGEDWAREKWTGFARWYQRQCERVAARAANVVIADARVVQQRYRERYGCDAVFAPYGGDRARDERTEALQRWGLTPQGYYLYVGRLVPENAVDLLLRAFANVRSPRRLVIVGDAPYVDAYKASLRRLGARDPRVVFTGYAFGADYAQLSSHCYVYLQPSAVQGTRPALLDQLGFGNCVLVRGSSANLEVVADAGYAFDHGAPEAGLAAALQRLDADPEAVARGRRKGQARVSGYYQWEWVTSFYEDLFQRVLQGEPLRSYDEWLASGPLRADAAVSTP